MNLFTKQKQTQKTNLRLPEGEGISQEFGINGYKPLYVKQRNNKFLPHSTAYSVSCNKIMEDLKILKYITLFSWDNKTVAKEGVRKQQGILVPSHRNSVTVN